MTTTPTVSPPTPPSARTGTQRGAIVQRVMLGTIAVSGGILVLLRDPRVEGSFPVCPSLGLTGCYCPGCGSMRAVTSLLTGDVLAALSFNIFVIPALIWMAWWMASPWLRRPAPSSVRGIIVVVVLVAVFTVVRNIPGSWFAP